MADKMTVGGGGAQPSYLRSKSAMTSQREVAEQEALGVLAGEVCPWLTQTLQVDITPNTFMESLDTGVELCRLAELIQAKAKDAAKRGEKLDAIHCHKTAKKGSFHARENTNNFTEWCKSMGIKDDVIFESNGLVEHSDVKRVLLCLLEVSRYARKVHIRAPKIVEIEHRIDERERGVKAAADDQMESGEETRNLDDEVLKRAKRCKCSSKKLTVSADDKRPMLGKYLVSGGKIRDKKVIHVRRLSNTIMVRVGGGWVTLDSFLMEHDPCRIECLS